MSEQENKEITTDSDKITKLLEASGYVDAKLLHTITTKAARGEVISQSERKLLKTIQAELEQKQQTSTPEKNDLVFKNPLAVVQYLRESGYKIGKSALYKYVSEGRLKPQKDGTYSGKVILRFAAMYLKRIDGGTPQTQKAEESAALDDLQRQKIEAEVKKAQAQAEHWEKRNKDLDAEVDTRVDQRLAQQSIILKTDLRNFAHAHAPSIIEIVEGNQEKVTDLIAWLSEQFEGHLARYAAAEQTI